MKHSKEHVERIKQLYFDAAENGLTSLSDDINKPDAETAQTAINGCLNSRTGVWRKTKPASGSARLLWELVKFHRSGGSLWGYPHFADPDDRDKLDTLALVLLKGQSSAANAWSKALGR